MTDSPEYQAMLRGVLECPFDDSPREVLADWLEETAPTTESAEWAFAKNIRAGLEYQRLARDPKSRNDLAFENKQFRLVNDIADGIIDCPSESARLYYYDRDDPHKFRVSIYLGELREISRDKEPRRDKQAKSGLDRGFLQMLSCSRKFFFDHAIEIFKDHPITNVILTDVAPYRGFNASYSFDVTSDYLEPFISHEWKILCPVKKDDRNSMKWNRGANTSIDEKTELAAISKLSKVLVDIIRDELGLTRIYD